LFLPSDLEVINRFNFVIRGLLNYYSGVNSKSSLYELLYLLKRSAALTLAHRHKLKSVSKAFHIWGKNLKVKSTYKGKTKMTALEIPELSCLRTRFRISVSQEVLMSEINFVPTGNVTPKITSIITSVSELQCVIPFCRNVAQEWYHIKYKQYCKSKLANQRTVLDLAGKQIPVCLKHYQSICKGQYDGKSLRELEAYPIV